MTLHAFVAMPYGIRKGIDFNRVYLEYIKPALESAGFEVFRADEESRAGDIRTDMFQELLIADLVVADLSIDNPNVWYELGVRHALRSRGVIQIQCMRDYMPFDVYVDRVLRYHVKDGLPDPDLLKTDKKALADFATATIEAWHGRKISPVYHLLRYLREPEWTSLQVDEAREFWEAHHAWENRIEVARRRSLPGDILVLAEELHTRGFRLEAYKRAAQALRSLGQFRYSLEQYEKALTINPTDLESRQQKGLLLNRLGKYDEAKEWLKDVTESLSKTVTSWDRAETWALLGRIEKEAWINSWRREGRTVQEMCEDAAYEDVFLREVIETYARGFRADPSHYYSGINAVTLLHLLWHLTGKEEKAEERQAMQGGIRWAVQTAITKRGDDYYWAKVTLGDLEVLTGDKDSVERAYKEAVAVAEKDWFKLDSPRQQLLILRDLGFRPQVVDAALKVFDRAMGNLNPPEARWEPHRVFLFSGHMIDSPGRSQPRFPADKEEIASKAIAKKLDELGAGPQDLAISGGACGGDLLFAEACLARGVRLEVHIPLDEPHFLHESVNFAGEKWRDRFYTVKANPNTKLFVMQEEIGPPHSVVNPHARNNLWLLYTALARGPEKVRFLCLWDRKGGDGPGGTQDMYDAVLEHSGYVCVLDITQLW